MSAQSGAFYNQPEIKSAVSYFRRKSNGFYDAAFEYQDIQQEAAIAHWLGNTHSRAIYSALVDEWRKINFYGRRSVSEFETLAHGEYADSAEDSTFWFDLQRAVDELAAEWPELESFIGLYYIDGQDRDSVKHELGITEWRCKMLINKTKDIVAAIS